MEHELYRETKWLQFYIVDRKPKTVVIDVINTSHQHHLGVIKWHGPWRQYIYINNKSLIVMFNNGCLQDIAGVLTDLNKEHKEKSDEGN